MGKQSDERFVRRHQGDPAGFVRGIEQQAFARPRRDHRDDGAEFRSRYVVDPATGCHNWTGNRFRRPSGELSYGVFTFKKRQHLAHRYAWYLAHREWPPADRELDHRCRNVACVNTQHLDPVTHRENVLRSPIAVTAINASKSECIRGHPFTADNTWIGRLGNRHCRECRNERNRAYRRRLVLKGSGSNGAA